MHIDPITIRVGVAVAAFAFLTGCTTPLGSTTYPVIADDGLLGVWSLELSLEQSDSEPMQPLILMVERTEQELPRGARRRSDDDIVGLLQAMIPEVEHATYSVTFESIDNCLMAQDITIIGQLLETSAGRFFSFQRSVYEIGPYVFHVPIQYTVRVQREGDVLQLWLHESLLVWTPVPLAGELAFNPPDLPVNGGPQAHLVQYLDDAIRYYAESEPTQWYKMGKAHRVNDVRLPNPVPDVE